MNGGEDRALRRVEEWVERRLGLHFDDEQRPAMRRRLRGLMDRSGWSSPEDIMEALARDSEGTGKLLAETVATHHTAFFREPRVLQHFATKIVSDLKPRHEPHRVWSAASSTGQEAYTLAIILAEQLGLETARQNWSILGTDLVQKVVETAARGRYLKAGTSGISPERMKQWFTAETDGRYQIHPGLQALCTFRRLNLLREPWPFQKKFSVILCRNVLYYFARDIQMRIVERLYDATEPGGWLLTGVSESLHDFRTRWQTHSSGIHRKM